MGFDGGGSAAGNRHRRAGSAKGVCGGVGAPFEFAAGDRLVIGVDDTLQGVAGFAVGGAGGLFDRGRDFQGGEGFGFGSVAAFAVGDECDRVFGVGFEAFDVAGDGLGTIFALNGALDHVAVGVLALGGADEFPVG